MADPTVNLAADEVHVWLARPGDVDSPADRGRCWALLSPDERLRHDRFQFDRDRELYLVAHALLRTSLSRYAAIAPPGWRFVTASHGRPELAPTPDAPPLRFNLSHTHGLIACAIALDRDVGVDVEWHDRRGDLLALAAEYFAPAELAALRALPADQQLERFFSYWTLKEAYIKARGLGLSIPLEQFGFDLTAGRDIAVSFTHPLVDDPARWQFGCHQPTPQHTLAYALRRDADRPARARVAFTPPLGD